MKYLLPILSIFMMSCDPDCPLGSESCNTIDPPTYPEICTYGDFTNRTTIYCEPCEDFFDRIEGADEEWESGCIVINDEWHELCYSTRDLYEDCEDYCDSRVQYGGYEECIVVD